ncbi:MAG TPA: PAS domain-containing protein, partial [Pyrinomonadaceae bacterium]|nr:PAS domain-containing protein [Pyrinomonadaceae bacterium]
MPHASAPQTELTREPQRISLGELHQKLLEQYGPSSVVIDQDYNILHLSGHAGHFLQFAGGEPSRSLLRVVHPELRIELRTALFQAAKTGKSFEARRVKIDRDERDFYINIIVRPVHHKTRELQRSYFLVFFDEVERLSLAESSEPRASGAQSVVGLLEEELQITKEQQQATIEQYETQTEELKASNEELQAMNEELRSATEELETGKEELQSVNEEIQTINAELKQKIDELAISNSDLQNLITSTDLATIFVDRDLKIKFYTPRGQDIFSLIPSDIGRPLSDITHKLDYASMLQDVRHVLADGHKTELEVMSRERHWYIAQLIPYRLHEDDTEGVILTFIDFTRRKEAENEAQAAREGLERHTVALMEINEALQTEVSERQRGERERGQLVRRIVFAQEEERARIAREMHDQFGQQLTVLNLKLDVLRKDCGDNITLCEQVETLQALAQEISADVDTLVWEMRPMALDDLGLRAALTSYVQSWSSHVGIPLDLHATGLDRGRLTIEIETVLYRIAQEALNNVAKHAHATNVAIVLEQR